MSTQYAPVYAKDLDQYIVPGLAADTVEQAVIAGGEAQLQNTYGLAPNGEVVSLENGQYQGPYIIANVGDKQAWIIGGPTLDALLNDRHPAVENIPEEEVTPEDDDGADLGPLATAIIDAAVTQVLDAPAATEPTPEFGGGGGFDGAGAGGAI